MLFYSTLRQDSIAAYYRLCSVFFMQYFCEITLFSYFVFEIILNLLCSIFLLLLHLQSGLYSQVPSRVGQCTATTWFTFKRYLLNIKILQLHQVLRPSIYFLLPSLILLSLIAIHWAQVLYFTTSREV